MNAHSQALDFVQRFQAYLEEEVQAKVPGYAVGIITDEGAHKIVGGVREVGKLDVFDENTIFRLASVSKTFASAAVVALQHPDINFDSSVDAFLPDLVLSNSEYQSKLTLGHILSQSSGLLPHAYTNLIQDNVPYKQVLKKLQNVDFICEPGNCYSYQNVVYSLVGDVLAVAGESSYEQIVEEKLFKALGMTSTSFGLDGLLAYDNRAMPHRWNGKFKRWEASTPKANYYQLSPSAGVNTNLNDMLRWIEVQLGRHPNILSEDDLGRLHAPAVKTSRRQSHSSRSAWRKASDFSYALGWRTFTFDSEAGFVHHGGWVEGFRVEMVVNRRLDIGMFFVTNSEPGLASDIVPEFITLYLEHAKEAQQVWRNDGLSREETLVSDGAASW